MRRCYTSPVPVAGRSTSPRLLRLWVWIPLGSWMFVFCECCVWFGCGSAATTSPARITLCGWLSGCRLEFISILYTRQSSTQSDKCQVWHRYRNYSWWWAHSRPKHVKKRNKHTKKKFCAKLALFARLYKDARSTKRKKKSLNSQLCFARRNPIHRIA
jgi:hypothetical protein